MTHKDKIYVLIYNHSLLASEVHGVFTTYEQADEAKERLTKQLLNEKDYYTVEEHALDAEVGK